MLHFGILLVNFSLVCGKSEKKEVFTVAYLNLQAAVILEPHCLTDDGRTKRIGEEWIKVHHTHGNIRWRCLCKAHGKKHCHDIGKGLTLT